MKKFILIVGILLVLVSFYVFSEDKILTLYIDQTVVETEAPVFEINGKVMVPMVSTFKALGAQVYEGDIITSYYLNTFVKVNTEDQSFAINGKKTLMQELVYREGLLYVPLNLLLKAFDLTILERLEDNLYLNANRVISYRNYEAIQYQQVTIKEDGIRFSIPLDWNILDHHQYGYNSSYGRVSVHYNSMVLNKNIDTNLIIDTYYEDLILTYEDQVKLLKKEQKIYNYLTSNVLYINVDVNDIAMKRVVNFITSKDRVYIIEFSYPRKISDSYINNAINNIMDSFYIDAISFDSKSEHYIETLASIDLGLNISSTLFSNMTVEDAFVLEGYFNSEENIESLTVTSERNGQSLEFYIPVENNSFYAQIHTPFGLGKHNIRVALSSGEEKVAFDSITSRTEKRELDLLRFSVVNLSDQEIRYSIPTKMVQSDHELITSMSNLLTYKFSTNYSKAKALYDFITEEVELLESNQVNYTALDVYEHFQGTKKEIALYLTALLRAQEIPAKMVLGTSDYGSHIWIEAYLNGEWLIIDPVGDYSNIELLSGLVTDSLTPGFNSKRSIYNTRYLTQKVMAY